MFQLTVDSMPLLNLPPVCTAQPAPRKAFCDEHCKEMEEHNIPTTLKEFISYCKGMCLRREILINKLGLFRANCINCEEQLHFGFNYFIYEPLGFLLLGDDDQALDENLDPGAAVFDHTYAQDARTCIEDHGICMITLLMRTNSMKYNIRMT